MGKVIFFNWNEYIFREIIDNIVATERSVSIYVGTFLSKRCYTDS